MRYDHSPLHTASFYGFMQSIAIKPDKKDEQKAKQILALGADSGMNGLSFDHLLPEQIALIKAFWDKKYTSFPQPLMVYRALKNSSLALDIIGNSKSIADAIGIETTYAILKDQYGAAGITVELNSTGDRESFGRFQRELGNYIKKHWAEVPLKLRPLLKKNIFAVFSSKDKASRAFADHIPQSIGCLSDASRKHFKEVLEYIEALAIPYSINHKLMLSPSFMNETMIRITLNYENDTPPKVLAVGGRYSSLAKKALGKKDIPAFGMYMNLNTPLKQAKKVNYKLFFIQLGFDAKLKSFHVLELLRQANIPVYQSLSKDKLSTQIAQAEKMKVPYMLLMGKKEAMEGCVVVRNMSTRCQESIALKDLTAHLKKML